MYRCPLNRAWHDLCFGIDHHNKSIERTFALNELARKSLKKPLVAVGGGLLVTIGAILLLLPGPGLLLMILGLSILATEFLWARKRLRRMRDWLRRRRL